LPEEKTTITTTSNREPIKPDGSIDEEGKGCRWLRWQRPLHSHGEKYTNSEPYQNAIATTLNCMVDKENRFREAVQTELNNKRKKQ